MDQSATAIEVAIVRRDGRDTHVLRLTGPADETTGCLLVDDEVAVSRGPGRRSAVEKELIRDVRDRADVFGLTGTTHLRALETLRARLRVVSSDPDRRAYRFAARALGVPVPGKPGGDRWREALESRIEVLRRFVDRRHLAGPIGDPGVRYSLALADPPWRGKNLGTRAAPGYSGSQRGKMIYETMSDAEICDLGEELRGRLTTSAVLGLWIPDALMIECLSGDSRIGRVCDAWGFRSPSTFVTWLKLTSSSEKIGYGMGNYGRACTEQLLLATRGDNDIQIVPGDGVLALASRGIVGEACPGGKKVRRLICGPPTVGRHSSKPLDQYRFLAELCGPVRAIELFAWSGFEGGRDQGEVRHGWPTWHAWGDCAPDAAKTGAS